MCLPRVGIAERQLKRMEPELVRIAHKASQRPQGEVHLAEGQGEGTKRVTRDFPSAVKEEGAGN